jgi:hypothetical protein
MSIPISENHANEIARSIARLERKKTGQVRQVRRLLYKARLWLVEGNEDEAFACLDAAIDFGLDPSSVEIGPNALARINALIDRPESQAHALGLLFLASELLSGFDDEKARAILDVTESLDNSADYNKWKEVATPRRGRGPQDSVGSR